MCALCVTPNKGDINTRGEKETQIKRGALHKKGLSVPSQLIHGQTMVAERKRVFSLTLLWLHYKTRSGFEKLNNWRWRMPPSPPRAFYCGSLSEMGREGLSHSICAQLEHPVWLQRQSAPSSAHPGAFPAPAPTLRDFLYQKCRSKLFCCERKRQSYSPKCRRWIWSFLGVEGL